VGVSNDTVLELEQITASEDGGPLIGCRLRRRPTSGGRALRAIDLPPVRPPAHNASGAVWFQAPTRPELVCVDAIGGVRRVRADIDCRAYTPPATIPDNFDVGQFEAREVRRLRAAFFGGWFDEDGAQHPFISGVEFTAVELRGAFPATQVVAHPDTLFGRRWDSL